MPRRPSAGRKSRRKPRYRRGPAFWRDDSYMRAYEERIIMRDILAMTSGGEQSVSVARLRLFAPMRYSARLVDALERMSHGKAAPLKLTQTGRGAKSRRVYHLREQARIREGVAA